MPAFTRNSTPLLRPQPNPSFSHTPGGRDRFISSPPGVGVGCGWGVSPPCTPFTMDPNALHFSNYDDEEVEYGGDDGGGAGPASARPPGAEEEAAEGPAPWDALGRDSEAGRLIFRLYGRDVRGHAKGNTYSAINAAQLERKKAAGVWPFPSLSPPTPLRAVILRCRLQCLLFMYKASVNGRCCPYARPLAYLTQAASHPPLRCIPLPACLQATGRPLSPPRRACGWRSRPWLFPAPRASPPPQTSTETAGGGCRSREVRSGCVCVGGGGQQGASKVTWGYGTVYVFTRSRQAGRKAGTQASLRILLMNGTAPLVYILRGWLRLQRLTLPHPAPQSLPCALFSPCPPPPGITRLEAPLRSPPVNMSPVYVPRKAASVLCCGRGKAGSLAPL